MNFAITKLIELAWWSRGRALTRNYPGVEWVGCLFCPSEVKTVGKTLANHPNILLLVKRSPNGVNQFTGI